MKRYPNLAERLRAAANGNARLKPLGLFLSDSENLGSLMIEAANAIDQLHADVGGGDTAMTQMGQEIEALREELASFKDALNEIRHHSVCCDARHVAAKALEGK